MSIQKSFFDLYQLTKQKDLDKEKYISILQSMDIPIPNVKNDYCDNFKKDMEEKRILLYQNDNFSKMEFWYKYILFGMWSKIRNDSMGSLSELNIHKNRFSAKIFVNLNVMKNNNETSEEYFQREKVFLKNTEYSYVERMNSYYICDTDENKKRYLDYLSSFLNISHYNFSTKDGFILSLTIHFNDINVKYEIEDNDINWSLSVVENMEKELANVCHAFQSVPAISIDILNHLVAGVYFDLCNVVGIENEYTKKYYENFCSDREKNLMIRKKSNEVGKTYDCEILKSIVKEISEKLEQYLAKKYCLALEDISYNNCGLKFRCYFSLDCWFVLDIDNNDDMKFYFDDIVEKDTYGYSIPAIYIDRVVKELEKDIHVQFLDTSLKKDNGKIYINKMDFSIKDIYSLTQKVPE